MVRYSIRFFAASAFVSCFALIGLSACSFHRNLAIAQPPTETSSPTMSSTMNSQLTTANQQFGFKLFSQLLQQDSEQNLMMSPTSVAIALSMLYNGASGETQQEIARTLGVQELSVETLNQANAELKAVLEAADPQVTLAIANSLWGNQNVVFQPSFLQRMQTFYHAEVETLDFNHPSAVNLINAWVNRSTEGKISAILDEVRPEDLLFLINAVYFKGEWQQAFDAANTRDRSFTLLDGRTKQHPLMSQTGNFYYQENEHFQAVSLPYGNGRLRMDIFLPQADGSLLQFYQEFIAEQNWNAIMTRFIRRDGTVELPRFRYEYETRLNDALQALGMLTAFDPNMADLSGLSEQDSFVNEVRHKTFIEVNEEGTEAAAVTSIGIQVTSAQIPIEPFTMTVDRPFFYVIRDTQSGAILFMGTVVDPVNPE